MTHEQKSMIDALVRRLVELGADQTGLVERATSMINGWEWFSENSVDGERGHETCRDWMDAEVVRILDVALVLKYSGSSNETLARLRDVVGGPFYANADEKLAAVARILWPEQEPENRPPQPTDNSPCPF